MSHTQSSPTTAQPVAWKLVPSIPTPRMVEVGCDNNPTQWTDGTDDGFAADVANDIYVSMVAAAPSPTPAPGDVGEIVRGLREFLRGQHIPLMLKATDALERLSAESAARQAQADIMYHRILASEARLAEAVEALKRISGQKLSVELSEEEFVEDHEADFEGGYNSIIEMARAAIKRAVECAPVRDERS